MIVTIIVNVFAVFLALLARNSDYPKKNLLFSFFLLFVFLALRYDFGNDYMSYYNYYSKFHGISLQDLARFYQDESSGILEIGYTFLNVLIPNFYLFVVILSLLSCYSYYNLINYYAVAKMIWFSLFIFLFDSGLMLIQSSALRQTVAICLFILSIRFLIERHIWKYFILIVLGSFFHRSAIVLLPIYFLVTPTRWGKWILITLVAIYFIIALFGYAILPSIEYLAIQLFPKYLEAYMSEISGNKLSSGLGFLFWSLVFIFIMWSHNKEDERNIVISKLTILSFVLSPFGMYLNMFGRVVMYFAPFVIISLPNAVSYLKDKDIRKIFVFVLIFWYLFNFYTFFQDPLWTDKFSEYKINLIHGE